MVPRIVMTLTTAVINLFVWPAKKEGRMENVLLPNDNGYRIVDSDWSTPFTDMM